ncbi:PREDICTED: splicing factor 3B subunit 4 [Tarenaya hassleriana]|uniref:splicing factor 3B subunit 4 n=1 Tax=Tarenaya hassleriana TaxID=28532 RepID=UPI00053C5941|nr:PREDICTED: splicing factor 3B subunit 4 [Tarenaya hassleriana]
MSGNSNRTVYIGNIDERVSDRVLYDIMIEAGRVVDLHIPRDKETDKPKGFAFAEYETEEIAEYAVKLFSGLVTLYNRTLKFNISGQDKFPPNSQSAAISGHRAGTRPHSLSLENTEMVMGMAPHSERFSAASPLYPPPPPMDYYSQEPPPPGVSPHSNGYGHFPNGEYSRRALGSTLDSISRSSPRWH